MLNYLVAIFIQESDKAMANQRVATYHNRLEMSKEYFQFLATLGMLKEYGFLVLSVDTNLLKIGG